MIPPEEIIVETKKCRLSGKEFFVTNRDLEFYDKISPISGGTKYSIPSPTLCPEERMRNIQCFINQRHLYRIKSCLSGQEMMSNFGPHCPFPVCSVQEWYGDGWNPRDYAQDIITEDTFFSQFKNFISRIPHWSLSQGNNNENSEYTNHGQGNKSCYMLLTGSNNTQVYHAMFVYNCINCIDCDFSKECELCFECVDVQKSYRLFWSVDCSNCSESFLLKSCTNCQNCFGCCNLSGKSFHIFNQDVGEAKYREFLDSYFGSPEVDQEKVKKDIARLWQTSLQSHMHGYSNQDAIGDYIYNSSHVFNAFEVKNSQDIKNCVSLDGVNSTYDCIMSRNSEWNYYSSLVSAHSSHVAFCSAVMGGSRVYYSDSCVGASDCFACSGLHSHEHHCIMNKPYSVQEYESRCSQLIDHMRSTGEWGEFFPHSLSPFGYNETIAQEYFPMTEKEVKEMPRFGEWNLQQASLGREVSAGRRVVEEKSFSVSENNGSIFLQSPGISCHPLSQGGTVARGWNWYNEPQRVQNIEPLHPLPISEYDEKIVGYESAQKNIDALLHGIIVCEVTRKPFKIIKQELAFYIENSLPIPTKHPDQRHQERMDLRNPRILNERTCGECGKDIITTYARERPERVVCEECYRKMVY